MTHPTKRIQIRVADHIVGMLRYFAAKGNTYHTNIVVFSPTRDENDFYSYGVTQCLQHSGTHVFFLDASDFIRTRCLFTGFEVLIRFFALSRYDGTQISDANHIVSIGVSLYDPVMMDILLLLSTQNKITAVVVTDEELKKTETKLQSLKKWAFEEMTRDENCIIIQRMLPSFRFFIPYDSKKLKLCNP